jgi:hypothetical protein
MRLPSPDAATEALELPSIDEAGRAASITRGVQALMAGLDYASLSEVSLANGRRADVMALSPKGEIVILEVKSCLNDFRTDHKWPEYAPFCDRFYFAVDCDFPRERLPADVGLVVADAFGGAVLREAVARPLPPARRKQVTLAFARLAAWRLLRGPAGEVGRSAGGPAVP